MQSISESDFGFVFHAHPVRFFKGPRPLRVIETPPPVEIYDNAIYTPAVTGWYPHTGCLYDESLARIEASTLYLGRHDFSKNKEPARFVGEPHDLPVYDQPLLYLGYIHPAYGHFLLETLSYWWYLITEHRHYDRYLIHIYDPHLLDKGHIKACLSALGIDAEKIVFFDRPTRINRVVVASPAFQFESHIHTQHRSLLNHIVTALGAADEPTTDQPLYVSRTQLKHGKDLFVGEEAIEAFFAQRGARILHPEQLAFNEQARIFNRHRRVYGMIGSGMHNLVMSVQPKKAMHFTTHKIVENFFLVDRCYDSDSTYVMATERSDALVQWLKTMRKTIVGRRRREEGFLLHHRLDVPRLIDWLQTNEDW